jgi:hypothetical protein
MAYNKTKLRDEYSQDNSKRSEAAHGFLGRGDESVAAPSQGVPIRACRRRWQSLPRQGHSFLPLAPAPPAAISRRLPPPLAHPHSPTPPLQPRNAQGQSCHLRIERGIAYAPDEQQNSQEFRELPGDELGVWGGRQLW